jgi:hypothetical protein
VRTYDPVRDAELDLILDVENKLSIAQRTAFGFARQPKLLSVMEAVLKLPKREHPAGYRAALYVAREALPGTEAKGLVETYLMNDLDRRMSNTERLMRALKLGGITEPGPFQDNVVERTATIVRRLARRFPASADRILYRSRVGIGPHNSSTFDRKLKEALGPEYKPSSYAMESIRRAMEKPSTFGTADHARKYHGAEP